MYKKERKTDATNSRDESTNIAIVLNTRCTSVKDKYIPFQFHCANLHQLLQQQHVENPVYRQQQRCRQWEDWSLPNQWLHNQHQAQDQTKTLTDANKPDQHQSYFHPQDDHSQQHDHDVLHDDDPAEYQKNTLHHLPM